MHRPWFFSFSDILRIENLWQFTNLRKLQLDNNIIEEVVGLENLVHLEWLDLSFNNIEVIGGLDTLVNLKDLSLASNRIQTIGNLDALAGSLQVLSLANNLIEDLKNVRMSNYTIVTTSGLRKFGVKVHS